MRLRKTCVYEHTSYVDFLKEVYAVNVKRGKMNYGIIGKQLNISKMKAFWLVLYQKGGKLIPLFEIFNIHPDFWENMGGA